MSNESKQRLQAIEVRLRQADQDRLPADWEIAAMRPEERRQKARIWHQRMHLIDAIKENGAGLLADQTLRRFLVPLDETYMVRGSASLPIHFQITEAFFRYAPRDDLLVLLKEHDHLIQFGDFLDYATGPSAADEGLAAAYGLVDGEIYNYTTFDDPHETLFSADNNARYGMAAVSMVRRGNDLIIALVTGEEGGQHPPGEQTLMFMKGFSEEECRERQAMARRVTLPDAPDLEKTLAVARFDLAAARLDARYVIDDFGAYQHLYSDEMSEVPINVLPDIFKDPAVYRQLLTENQRQIEARRVLFEIARLCVLLPAYLNYRVSYTEFDHRATPLADALRASLHKRKEMARVPPEQKILLRRVAAVRPIPATPTPAVASSRTPPTASVSVNGFWRYFRNPRWIGHDPQGQPVTGRTWVASHTRWKDLPAPGAHVVRVKDSVAAAEQRVEAELRAGVIDPPPDWLKQGVRP